MTETPPKPAPGDRAAEIRSMFGRLAGQYDRMNRVMSAGLDGRWRRLAAAAAAVDGAVALDLGCGTGDLSVALTRAGARRVVGGDFARPMLLAAGRKRSAGSAGIQWAQVDALQLPFADNTFDAVTSGFLLRNLVDLPAGLTEMLRVLKPGGRLVALDITQPPRGVWGAVLRFGFARLVTPLAGLLSGDRAAYRYLPGSVQAFLTAADLAALMADLGAVDVRVRRLAGGGVALHQARKGSRAYPI